MKTVNEEVLTYIVRIERSGVKVNVECRGDYEVTSDGISQSRSKVIDITSKQKEQLAAFGKNTVLGQIKNTEG